MNSMNIETSERIGAPSMTSTKSIMILIGSLTIITGTTIGVILASSDSGEDETKIPIYVDQELIDRYQLLRANLDNTSYGITWPTNPYNSSNHGNYEPLCLERQENIDNLNEYQYSVWKNTNATLQEIVRIQDKYITPYGYDFYSRYKLGCKVNSSAEFTFVSNYKADFLDLLDLMEKNVLVGVDINGTNIPFSDRWAVMVMLKDSMDLIDNVWDSVSMDGDGRICDNHEFKVILLETGSAGIRASLMSDVDYLDSLIGQNISSTEALGFIRSSQSMWKQTAQLAQSSCIESVEEYIASEDSIIPAYCSGFGISVMTSYDIFDPNWKTATIAYMSSISDDDLIKTYQNIENCLANSS